MFLLSSVLTGASLGSLLGEAVKAVSGIAKAATVGTFVGAGAGLLTAVVEMVEDLDAT